MPSPELDPSELDHIPFNKTAENNENLSEEKINEHKKIGERIAKIKGIRIKDINHMPENMMQSFLEKRRSMNKKSRKFMEAKRSRKAQKPASDHKL